MAEKKKRGRWKVGESGNPKGRKPGTGEVAKLRDDIAEHIPAIIQQLVTKAKEGDTQAAKLLLERVIPSMKPIEETTNINLPANTGLFEQGQLVMQAVAKGSLAPGQGSALIASLGALARVKEIDELEKRLTTLEEANEYKK